MSILAIKQVYIVKSVLFISFLFVMSLSLIGGCSDGGGGNDSQALTENDFAEDSSLRAELDEGVIVTFLESPESEEAVNDTGTLGVDEIPVTFIERTEQTLCWEDDDAGAMHFMELRDSQESVILTVVANGECKTEVIEEGDYVMSIHHDESVGDALPIFLIPNLEEAEQARKSEGLIDRLKLATSNLLKRIETTVTKDALAQDSFIVTIARTGSCVECNMRLANLRNRRFVDVDLTGANLTFADMLNTQMERANLTGVDFTGASMTNNIFTDVNLTSANLSGVRRLSNTTLIRADLTSANVSGATLIDAHMPGAICFSTDFSGANLIDAILTNATLNDATLNGARLNDASMIGARFNGADLIMTNLSDAVSGAAEFNDANLRGAIFIGADSRGAFFRRANLSGANLTDANFSFVNFTSANLTGAVLNNTDFSFATWCPGTCSCSEDSIDTCVGCTPLGFSSLDFCTGP